MAEQPWANSGTTPAAPTALAVDVRNPVSKKLAGALAVRNMGDTNALQISFDYGRVFVPTVLPGQSFSVRLVAIDTIFVRAVAGTTPFEWVAKDQYA